MKPIRKAVFPVAGLGTRFLPATKASPKEMLAIVDKPLIQYAVEEAVEAGIEELIFVTSIDKQAIKNHFSPNSELESRLKQKQQFQLLKMLEDIPPKHVKCSYVNQENPHGLGHAVLCAKAFIKDEPFAVLLADDLIQNNAKGCLQQMIEIAQQHDSYVLATEMIPADKTDQYGMASIDQAGRVKAVVEKPKPAEAPSNQAIVGRYILPPEIFAILDATEHGRGGEIQLTDAIEEAIEAGIPFVAHAFEGVRYDCGSKLGYLQANLEFALQHPTLGKAWRDYLKERLNSL